MTSYFISTLSIDVKKLFLSPDEMLQRIKQIRFFQWLLPLWSGRSYIAAWKSFGLYLQSTMKVIFICGIRYLCISPMYFENKNIRSWTWPWSYSCICIQVKFTLQPKETLLRNILKIYSFLYRQTMAQKRQEYYYYWLKMLQMVAMA